MSWNQLAANLRAPRSRWGVTTVAGVALVAFVIAASSGFGADSPDGSLGSLANATCEAYREQDYERALQLSTKVVASKEADAPAKVDAYKCQACTYVALRQPPRAKGSIAGMLTTDATARFSPEYSYPPPVIGLYNTVRDSLFSGTGGTLDINTVAVGDFEDNSVYKGKFRNYDFSLFKSALVHTVTADLAEATRLKIVDRQRTGQLLDEIKLGQSGFADAGQAVKAGQFLGAQTFLFGQYMILSPKKVRIDARVVHTATGEVILVKQITGDYSGDPEKFLEIEKALVEAIADGIDKIASGSAGGASPLRRMTDDYFGKKSGAMKGRKDYVEAKFLTAEALELEDQGSYEEATKTWKKVLDVDPRNEIAAARIQVLATLM